MKEFLAARAVAFQSIDIANDAGGMQALTALGLRTVPVVTRGDDYIFGQSLRDVAAFLGLDDGLDGPLPAAVLHDRLQRVLDVARTLIAQVPDERIQGELPGRKRSYRSLGYHTFSVAETFVRVADGAHLEAGMYAAEPPAEMLSGRDVAGYGREVGAKLADWWAATDEARLAAAASTYYGEQRLHDVLERTTWHCAQHVRQLALVLELMDIEPADRLSPADLAGLPVPEKVWD